MAYFPIDMDGVLVKKETVYGTDPTPAATDFVRCAERAWTNKDYDVEFPGDRDTTASGDLIGARPAKPIGHIVPFDLPVELIGSGTVDTPPDMGALLQACGLSETVNASTSVVYTNVNTAPESVTIYDYSGNKLTKGLGARGSFVWSFAAGEVSIMRFAMQGLLPANPTEVAVPAITYGGLPITVNSVTFTIGGVSLDFEEATFDLGADVQRVHAGLDAEAVRIRIPRYRPIFTARVKVEAISAWDPWADRRARTSRVVQVVLGTAGGQRFTLDVAASYVLGVTPEDQAGLSGVSVQYRCMDVTITHD